MSTNDLYLLQRWSQARDAEAFAEIVSRYSGMVYNTARRILQNPADAEDVTQDCFLELARMGDRVRASLGGWLHTLATSRAVDHIRKEARRRAREAAHAETTQAADRPDWQAIQTHIDEAVDALPPELREPVVEHFFMRKTHAEIAEEMGLARSSVSHRIEKGIEAVRQYLSQRGVTLGAAGLLAAVMELPLEAVSTTLATALGRLALLGPTTTTTAAGTLLSLPAVKLLIAVVVVAVGIVGAWKLFTPPSPPAVSLHESVAPGRGAVGMPVPALQAARNVMAATVNAAPAASSPQLASATRPYLPAATESVLFGIVWDAEKDVPIPGARVVAAPEYARSASVETRADAFGAYRLYVPHDARSEWYYLIALAPRHARYAANVQLRSGAETRHDPRMAVGISIRVRVVDPEGAPLEGAMVGNAFGGSRNYPNFFEPHRTDAGGRAELNDLEFDRDRAINAEKDGYVGASADILAYSAVGQSPEVQLVLHPLRQRRVTGRVTDEEGRPVAGAHVHWESVVISTPSDTTTDASGEYALTMYGGHLGGGWASFPEILVAHKAGYAVGWRPCPSWSTGEAPVHLDFQLLAGHWLAGEVVDVSGDPVGGATVYALRGEGAELVAGYLRDQLTTGADGRFRLADLNADKVTLQILQSGVRYHNNSTIPTYRVQVDAATRIVLPPAQPTFVLRGLVVDDSTGGPVSEFAVRSGNAAEVSFHNPDGRFEFIPWDSYGRNPGPSDWRLQVSARGYADLSVGAAEVTHNASGEVLLRLSREEPLRWRLVDDQTGNPLPRTNVIFGHSSVFEPSHRVLVWLPGGNWDIWNNRRAVTDGQGECVLYDGIAPGYVCTQRFFYAWPEGYAPLVVRPEDRSDVMTPDGVLVVRAQRGAQIAGTCTQGGVPASSLDVALFYRAVLNLPDYALKTLADNIHIREISSPDPRHTALSLLLRSATADADGHFGFTGLPDGNFVLEARIPGEASPVASAEITLASGEKKTVTLTP